jgi:hypothetical protein
MGLKSLWVAQVYLRIFCNLKSYATLSEIYDVDTLLGPPELSVKYI